MTLHRSVGALAVLAGLLATSPANAAGPITVGDGIGPATPYPSTIEVGGTDGIIEDVDVRIRDLVHEFPDDLDIALAGPGGQAVTLLSDTGTGGGVCPAKNLRFSAQATVPVPAGELPCNGTYLPTDDDSDDEDEPDLFPAPAPAEPYGNSLAVFNGSYPAGSWSLYVVDDILDDGGSIADWSLSLNTRPLGRVRIGSSSVHATEAQPTASIGLARSGGSAAAPLQAGSVGWSAEPCQPVPPAPSPPQATAGADFGAAQGSVAFAAGQVEQNIELGLLDDRLPEDRECVSIRLTSATGDVRLEPPSRLATEVRITNDDRHASPPAVSITGRQRVLRSKAVALAATSVADGRLSAAGTIALPRKASARLKPTTAAVSAGQRVTLKLRLSRRALKAVRQAFKTRRLLTARLRVTATDLAGGRATKAVRVTLSRR
jgi:subtilisin-like proprotein convertase family protein